MFSIPGERSLRNIQKLREPRSFQRNGKSAVSNTPLSSSPISQTAFETSSSPPPSPDMEFVIGRDPLLHLLQQHLQSREDDEGPNSHLNNSDPSPAKAYLRERNAMASTAVDVKEYPTSYVFIADMPGLKSSDIKVTVESGNVLLLSGERKKEDEGDSKVRYLSMERRALKFMRKFTLPSDADVEHIAAACQDGVLTVTVPKVPPPAPKVISVNVK